MRWTVHSNSDETNSNQQEWYRHRRAPASLDDKSESCFPASVNPDSFRLNAVEPSMHPSERLRDVWFKVKERRSWLWCSVQHFWRRTRCLLGDAAGCDGEQEIAPRNHTQQPFSSHARPIKLSAGRLLFPAQVCNVWHSNTGHSGGREGGELSLWRYWTIAVSHPVF